MREKIHTTMTMCRESRNLCLRYIVWFIPWRSNEDASKSGKSKTSERLRCYQTWEVPSATVWNYCQPPHLFYFLSLTYLIPFRSQPFICGIPKDISGRRDTLAAFFCKRYSCFYFCRCLPDEYTRGGRKVMHTVLVLLVPLSVF